MSNDKDPKKSSNDSHDNKREINKSTDVDSQRSSRIEKAINSESWINEGYQPSKPVDTNNPPKGNESNSDTEKSNG